MPRHMHGKYEKSKDFKGSMIKIIKSLRPWYFGIMTSLILALFSAILALIAPNKLSSLADTITAGITPRLDETKIKEIINNPNIPAPDKQEFMYIMNSATNTNDETEIFRSIESIPKSIYEEIKPIMDMARIKSIALFSIICLRTLF